MSIKLANDEKIVKSYEYAGVNKLGIGNSSGTSKKLIVTNKRIIHESITTGRGTDCVSTQEIPVQSAKYVNVYYGMKSYAILAVFCCISLIISLFYLFSSIENDSLLPLFFVFAILAVVFYLLYRFVKDYVVTCTILTDGLISPTMRLSSKDGSTLTRRARGFMRAADDTASINVKVKVKKEAAKEMAEELGSVIADVVAGHYDNVTED